MRLAAIAGLMVLALVGVLSYGGGDSDAQEPAPDDLGAAAAGCPATPHELTQPPGERPGPFIEQEGIWVAFGIGSGPVAAVAIHRKRDGSMPMKFGWWRDARVRRSRGKLHVWARRWPGGDPLVRFRQSAGFTVPKATFRASSVTFAGPGCWWITAKAGQARLHFVEWIVDADAPPADGSG